MRTSPHVTQEYPSLQDETLVTIAEACKRFPVPVSRPTVERLWRNGCRGVKLETIFLIGRRWTSVEAIRRFIERSQRTGDDQPTAPVKPTMSRSELESKRQKHNMPLPGKNGVAATR